MNILFISALLPYPLHSGGQVRMYNLLKELSTKHHITLYSFIRSEEETAYIRNLSFCANVKTFLRGNVRQLRYAWKAFTGPYPLLVASYDNSPMRQVIAKELSEQTYDCIHLEPFYVYPVLPKTEIPIVVSEHNIEYEVYRNLSRSLPGAFLKRLGAWDVAKLKTVEENIWQRANQITAVSQADASCIRGRTGKENVTVVPNGIDPTYFFYTTRPFARQSPKLLFVGNFSWKPNEDALRLLMKRYWPDILEKLPNATLTVCGKHISGSLLAAIRQKQITYRERVPDIRSLYASHDVLLAPFSYGGGTKFKILEAMASGALVVSTKAGVEGITVANRRECLIAETDDLLGLLVGDAYKDPKRSVAMTKRARTLMERSYAWSQIAQMLDGVWRSTL